MLLVLHQALRFGFDPLPYRSSGRREQANLDEDLRAPHLIFPDAFHQPIHQYDGGDPTLRPIDLALVSLWQQRLDQDIQESSGA